ncbi:GNAT family N-acetyltransferase [uncultured Roseibium sp.]|uniref:GNAT family N-acetyltransferase n=1 Tax=uncultured Roseibium sp. TaxID=1936171 RepID=UPI00262FF7B3|nr:GNAT family N-acetyltransferase [uncultured Roseibium sp.]
MNYKIRHAEPADAFGLHVILTSPHVVQGSMRLPYMRLKNTEDRLSADPNMVQIVAEDDGKVIGFAELVLHHQIPRAAHAAELNMVVTHGERQGEGIARSLIEELIRLCDGFFRIRRLSLIVWVDNTRAIKLYKHLGFEEEGCMRDYVRTEDGYSDALQMARMFAG